MRRCCGCTKDGPKKKSDGPESNEEDGWKVGEKEEDDEEEEREEEEEAVRDMAAESKGGGVGTAKLLNGAEAVEVAFVDIKDEHGGGRKGHCGGGGGGGGVGGRRG